MNQRDFYIYILTNKPKGVLYIGVTGNLEKRLLEHNQNGRGFPHRYNCNRLVYYEKFETAEAAIEREKQLKRWHRNWKINLITEKNPDWVNLTGP